MKKYILTLALLAMPFNAYCFPNMKMYGCEFKKTPMGQGYYSQDNRIKFDRCRSIDFDVLWGCDAETGYHVYIVPGDNLVEYKILLSKDNRESEVSYNTYIIDHNGEEVIYFEFSKDGEKGRFIYVPSWKEGWFQTFMFKSDLKDI